MKNLLLSKPEYQIEETSLGTWKRFLYPSGQSYAEFTSSLRLLGLPLLHYTSGRCPETGRRRIARGIIAVGRVAFGFFAVGQAAFGVVAVGQLALGLLLGLGQLAAGLGAFGQLCIGVLSVGQIAIGAVAVGQVAVGIYSLGQQGFGIHVWAAHHTDPLAREFFQRFLYPGS